MPRASWRRRWSESAFGPPKPGLGVLDDELVAKAMAKAGVSTKKAAIDTALRAYVREPDWQGLLALAGSGVLADDYDPAALFADASMQPMVSEPRPIYQTKRQSSTKPLAKSALPTVALRRK